MRTHPVLIAVLSLCFVSFSQTAYQKCVEECIRAGGDAPTCGAEICDPSDTTTDVVQGQGNPLFLISYELKGPAPVIDGSLMSRDGDPSTSEAMDEWKEACSRTIILNDSGVVQLFLVNSQETLYVGFTYEHGNNGDGSGVRLLFDEGNNTLPSQYDGSGDFRLSAPGGNCNEQGCAVYKSGGSVLSYDQCWNGTSWISDGDGQINFKGARYYYNSDLKVHHNEFAIPLNNGKSDGPANSDLNVNYEDIIGFYLEVIKTGAGAGTWHWAETNGNALKPDSFPYWAKIQLSVKRDYFTFYTGRGTNPPPVIDGSISEAVWSGAYQRELTLSNYHYGTYRCKIWCLEDSAQNNIYVGVRVFDKTHNTQDYCQVFLEETGENTTDPMRDYDLDNLAENSLKITNGGQFTDYQWNMDLSAWVPDAEAADAQSAKAGTTTTYADYEFKLLRSGGAEDVDIPKGGMLGFLVRYHDGDKTAQELSNYYWEYTTNNDAQLLDQQGRPFVYIATGWTNLQLGGPFIQIVKPAATDSLFGIVPVQVNSGNDSLRSVVCFLSSDTSSKVTLTYAGNGTWSGSINATNAPGDAMLIIRAVSASGVTTERIINRVGISMPFLQMFQALQPFTVMQSKSGLDFTVNLGSKGNFSLKVYTMTGRRMWNYHKENAIAGQNKVFWNTGRNQLRSGTYLIQLSADNRVLSGKLTVH